MKFRQSHINILFYPACLACILSSCASDTPEIADVSKASEVSFDVLELSRAAVTTSLTEFAVFGDMINTEVSDPEPTTLFNKTKVEYSILGWTYTGTQYWFPNHEHSFVAVYPLSVLEEENTPQYSNSKLTFIYSLPTGDNGLVKDNEVKDIVAATHRRLYNANDDNTVIAFQFAHLLTRINFSVDLNDVHIGDDEYLKIHKLEISGFDTSATLNIKPAPRRSSNQTRDSEIDIITDRGDGRLVIEFEAPITIKGTDRALTVKLFNDSKAIIMLPQTFAANEEVQISLTYSANDDAETNEVSATLNSFTWESGKSYNYKIKLELEQKEVNMVISQATIVPWNLIDDHDEVDAR